MNERVGRRRVKRQGKTSWEFDDLILQNARQVLRNAFHDRSLPFCADGVVRFVLSNGISRVEGR